MTLRTLVPALLAIAVAAAARPAAAAETFTYDALGRVLTARSDSGAMRTYRYDRAGNLLQIILS